MRKRGDAGKAQGEVWLSCNGHQEPVRSPELPGATTPHEMSSQGHLDASRELVVGGGVRQTWKAPSPLTSFLTRPQQQRSIAAMEGVMEALCKSGSLFEVTVPDYKQLKACHKEVRLLKELWDMIVMVRGRQAWGQGGGRLHGC